MLTFDLEWCLKESTHIFRGVVIDNKGTIAINEVMRGRSSAKQIRLPHLHREQMKSYGPQESYINWELIVFTEQDSLRKDVYHPASIIEGEGHDYSAINQLITTLWIKRDSAYQSFQRDYYDGPVLFGSWGPISRYTDRIENNNNFHMQLRKIKRKRSCKKKMRLITELHSDPKHTYDAYPALLEIGCPEQILEFLSQRFPQDTFTFKHRNELNDYIKIGQSQVKEQIKSMFDKEFAFWKNHIATHPEDKWWNSNNELYPRSYFFKTLIVYFIQYQIDDSSIIINQVYAYFDKLTEYNQVKNLHTIQKTIDEYRKYYSK